MCKTMLLATKKAVGHDCQCDLHHLLNDACLPSFGVCGKGQQASKHDHSFQEHYSLQLQLLSSAADTWRRRSVLLVLQGDRHPGSPT